MSEFTDTFKTNKHWATYITKTFKYKYNWCVGAYRSSKSVSNICAFAMQLETTPDKLHIVIASTVASARNIFEDADGLLGLKQYFGCRYQQTKYKGSDAGIIETPTGTKTVVYLGGAMESSYKMFRGWSVGMVVLEEANLLHENTIREAKGRTLMAQNPKYFISMNPTSPNAQIYDWLHELQAKNLVNYDRSTIYENPAISEQRRNEIIAEFDPDSLFYKQYILGQDVDAAGAIYNIRDYNILQDIDVTDYIDFIVVADPGVNWSATAFVLLGLKYDNTEYKYEMHVLKEYRHKNAESKLIKLPKEYAQDYCNFIQECATMIGRLPSVVYIDEDITFYRELCLAMSSSSIPTSLIKYVIKNDVQERIRQSVNALYQGKIRFYAKCTHTISNFTNAIYDPHKQQQGKFVYLDDPSGGTEIDLIDATCYGLNHFVRYLYLK